MHAGCGCSFDSFGFSLGLSDALFSCRLGFSAAHCCCLLLVDWLVSLALAQAIEVPLRGVLQLMADVRPVAKKA